MAKRKSTQTTRTDNGRLLSMWEENPDFQPAGLSYGEFRNTVLEFEQCTKEIEDARTKQMATQVKRNALYEKINTMCIRVRSAVRAQYGPDSVQLKQAGQVMRSERKAAPRKIVLIDPTSNKSE